MTEIHADSIDGSANPTGEAEPSETGEYSQNIDGSANPLGEAETSGPTTHYADHVPEQAVTKVIGRAEGDEAPAPKKSAQARTKKTSKK